MTCVRLENHLSPTLHPEVDTEGAAAHTEWESWRVVPPSPPAPRSCHLEGSGYREAPLAF